MTDELEPTEDETAWRSPRMGATCAHHPEREAVVRCALCDRDVCFSCFFPDHARCQRCVEDHPEEVSSPVPFESSTHGRFRGFFASIGAAFRPRATAASFAIGDSLASPIVFAILTFVPFAMLRGVIPYTHRLHFDSLGAMTVTRGSTTRDLVFDVFRASGLSLVESSVQLAVLAACYVSLTSAFGRPEARRIAMRAVGYRAFLLPWSGISGLLPNLLAWLGPPSFVASGMVLVVGALPAVPLCIALQRSARCVGRVDAVPGLALAIVPWLLFAIVGLLVESLLMPWLPPQPPA